MQERLIGGARFRRTATDAQSAEADGAAADFDAIVAELLHGSGAR